METIKPQLAQTAKEPFDHDDWLFELKLDGVRCIAYLDGDTRLQARSGQDITTQFPELQELHRQVVKPCILDGEIACATFNQVQHRIHRTKALDIRVARKLYPARFFAFDILSLGSQNLMPIPQQSWLLQEDVEVEGHRFTVTAIPTATSGGWYAIQDACEVWGAVAIDIDGTVLGWRSPPDEKYRPQLEEAIKKAFELPEV